MTNSDSNELSQATLGGGCFWCTDAVFKALRGVTDVRPGYAGGHVQNPSYEQVCTGSTGHAEVSRITFDPSVISFEQLLGVYFGTHDPTQLNRQGNDVGEQYRSVVFAHDEEQARIASEFKARLADQGVFDDSIVTAVEPLSNYYEAEANHHDFFLNNPRQGYCQAVIAPKVARFRQQYSHLLDSQPA